ncbi:MAG: nicotinate-nicotinamide nucleotide adenylyltransferase [Phycisphaerae bacterium]|nr:nicotinate-nicotinamide nucleotide adenylyltransferase [Phycisphaerae bacterium]
MPRGDNRLSRRSSRRPPSGKTSRAPTPPPGAAVARRARIAGSSARQSAAGAARTQPQPRRRAHADAATTTDDLGPITPLSIPRGARGVILFGGSFDPPHLWHTRIAVAARRRLFPRDGWLVFVPAAQSPMKAGPVAPAADRVHMLRLATRRLKRVRVWTDEIDRAARASRSSARSPGSGGDGRRASAPPVPRPSYTIDTVRRLRAILPASVPIRLLIGADQAVQFHKWKDFRELMTLAEPVVVLRPPLGTRRHLLASLRAQGAWSEEDLGRWGDRLVPCTTRGDSSTSVRELARRGSLVSGLTARAVRDFLRDRGLYGELR